MNLKGEIEIEPRLREAVDLGLVTKFRNQRNRQKPGRNITTIYFFCSYLLYNQLIFHVLANYNKNRPNNYSRKSCCCTPYNALRWFSFSGKIT